MSGNEKHLIVDMNRIHAAINAMLDASRNVPALTMVELYEAAKSISDAAKGEMGETAQKILDMANDDVSVSDFLSDMDELEKAADKAAVNAEQKATAKSA